MKKRRFRLLSLFLMLLLSVLSLTGVTYAWFTQGEKASVNQFQMDVESVTGLQLSLDAVHWYNDITNFSYNGELTPVSTIGEVDSTSKAVKFFKGTFANNKLSNIQAAVESTTSSTKGYFALTMYFKNTGSSRINVTLSDGDEFNTTVLCSEYTDDSAAYSSLATRIGFLKRGEVFDGSTSAIITALANNTGTCTIFEPNAFAHIQEALSAGAATSNAKANYYGVKATGVGPYDLSNVATLTDNFASVTTITDPTQAMFTINGNSIACVTIYIWLEGQDCDCTNYVSGKDLYVNLKFNREEQ